MPRECDWSRPCDCSDCRPPPSAKCDICEVEKGAVVESIYRKDRKGIFYYDFETYCTHCYNKYKKPEKDAYFNFLIEMIHKN